MQAMFPMICLIPNVVYFVLSQVSCVAVALRLSITQFQRIHIEAEFAEFVPFPTCVLPCLIDPILTIYYVAPYRNFVTRKRRIEHLGHTISVAPSTNRTRQSF